MGTEGQIHERIRMLWEIWRGRKRSLNRVPMWRNCLIRNVLCGRNESFWNFGIKGETCVWKRHIGLHYRIRASEGVEWGREAGQKLLSCENAWTRTGMAHYFIPRTCRTTSLEWTFFLTWLLWEKGIWMKIREYVLSQYFFRLKTLACVVTPVICVASARSFWLFSNQPRGPTVLLFL